MTFPLEPIPHWLSFKRCSSPSHKGVQRISRKAISAGAAREGYEIVRVQLRVNENLLRDKGPGPTEFASFDTQRG
jgi:hypothetical protein